MNREKENLKLGVKTNIKPKVPFDLNKDIHLRFSHPVTVYDFSDVIITEGSDSVDRDTVKYEVVFEDKAMKNFRITYPWKADSSYRLIIPRGNFKDLFKIENDSMQIDFKVRSLNYYGNLKFKLQKDSTKENEHRPPMIFQLLSEKESVIRENIISPKGGKLGAISCEYLKPGRYKAKLIFDDNSNGKWDTGDYYEKRQPERVIYYKGSITVRSNWDIELEWKIE